MASAQGSKSLRRVREQDSDGSCEDGIGEKRVSSKALQSLVFREGGFLDGFFFHAFLETYEIRA
jgi:hypothetical protein